MQNVWGEQMIIISPYSRPLRNNKENAKNYPWWSELTNMLLHRRLVQIGRKGEKQIVNEMIEDLSMKDLANLLKKSEFWIGIDNFLPHLAHLVKKKGVVLWGPSDPLIFGYSENLNILKDRSFLRRDQFGIWEECEYDPQRFVEPEEVIKAMREAGFI